MSDLVGLGQPRGVSTCLSSSILHYFQILAYNSKTMRPKEVFIPIKMKQPKVLPRITYLKVKLGSAVYPQSIVKDRQFLPTWRKSELCSLSGHHSSSFCGADPHNRCQLVKK